MNIYDHELDQASHNAGMQHLEKMVSGMYLGELSRRIILEMITKGLIFSMANLSSFSGEYTLHAKHLSLVANGSDFFEDFGLRSVSETDRSAIKEICRIVSTRSARIAGTAIAAVVTWMDSFLESDHTIAIDGALFERYPGYRNYMEDILRELFEERAEKIRLKLVKDGSGIGSAVSGAVALTV